MGHVDLHCHPAPADKLAYCRTLIRVLSSDRTHSVQLGNSVSKCVTWVGTVTYMAPERIAGGNQGYGLPSDIWSLGVTVMECALGRFPYQAQASMQWVSASGQVAAQHCNTHTCRASSYHCMACPLGSFTRQAQGERVHHRCTRCQ